MCVVTLTIAFLKIDLGKGYTLFVQLSEMQQLLQ